MATPGRPEIGPAFTVRFPVDLVDRIDTAARVTQVSRAAWLRAAAEDRLAYPRDLLSLLAAWMLNNGLSGDIAYALQKPWKYTQELYSAEHGIDVDTMDTLLARVAQVETEAPQGWMLEATSPVDRQLSCSHGAVILDTMAERGATRQPAGCDQGCILTTHPGSPAPSGAAPRPASTSQQREGPFPEVRLRLVPSR